jgi:hypothetical protein
MDLDAGITSPENNATSSPSASHGHPSAGVIEDSCRQLQVDAAGKSLLSRLGPWRWLIMRVSSIPIDHNIAAAEVTYPRKCLMAP